MPEVRHDVLVPRLDVGARVLDRLVGEVGQRAAVRLLRKLGELVQVGAGRRGRARRLERVAAVAALGLEERGAGRRVAGRPCCRLGRRRQRPHYRLRNRRDGLAAAAAGEQEERDPEKRRKAAHAWRV